MSVPSKLHEPELARRHRIGKAFEWLCCGSTWFGLVVLLVLLVSVLWQALTWPAPKVLPGQAAVKAGVDAGAQTPPLSLKFFTNYDSRHPREAGILAHAHLHEPRAVRHRHAPRAGGRGW